MLENMVVFASISNIADSIMNMLYDIAGSPLIIALIFLLFIISLALVLGFRFPSLLVVIIPAFFLIFAMIPGLRIIVGIMLGILIGLGLIQWIRR